MLPPKFVAAFFAAFAFKDASALQSSDLTPQDVIDFLTKGHIILRNVLPELREESFRDEHEHAKVEASKAYERFFLEFMECNEPDSNLTALVDAGEGALALKGCLDMYKDEGIEKDELAGSTPFYQIVNLHEYSQKIHDVATGPRFGSLVADLLQVDRVRLYQSRTFRKVPSKDDTMRMLFNHPTFLHADLSMVPLETNEYLTLWCPTRNLTRDDSVLTYATGSHRDITYRTWHNTLDYVEESEDEEEYDEDEEVEKKKSKKVEIKAGTGEFQRLEVTENEHEAKRIAKEDREINGNEDRYDIEWYDDINVGDCVAHHGWLLHGSTSQVFKNGPRDAITFAYIDGDARKLASAEDRSGEDFLDNEEIMQDQIMFRDWYYDIAPGEVVDHPKLPLVWPNRQEKDDTPSSETKATA